MCERYPVRNSVINPTSWDFWCVNWAKFQVKDSVLRAQHILPNKFKLIALCEALKFTVTTRRLMNARELYNLVISISNTTISTTSLQNLNPLNTENSTAINVPFHLIQLGNHLRTSILPFKNSSFFLQKASKLKNWPATQIPTQSSKLTLSRSPKIARICRISPDHKIALPKSATSQSQLKARRQTDGRTTGGCGFWAQLVRGGGLIGGDHHPPYMPVCFQVPSYSLWWAVWTVVVCFFSTL